MLTVGGPWSCPFGAWNTHIGCVEAVSRTGSAPPCAPEIWAPTQQGPTGVQVCLVSEQERARWGGIGVLCVARCLARASRSSYPALRAQCTTPGSGEPGYVAHNGPTE